MMKTRLQQLTILGIVLVCVVVAALVTTTILKTQNHEPVPVDGSPSVFYESEGDLPVSGEDLEHSESDDVVFEPVVEDDDHPKASIVALAPLELPDLQIVSSDAPEPSIPQTRQAPDNPLLATDHLVPESIADAPQDPAFERLIATLLDFSDFLPVEDESTSDPTPDPVIMVQAPKPIEVPEPDSEPQDEGEEPQVEAVVVKPEPLPEPESELEPEPIPEPEPEPDPVMIESEPESEPIPEPAPVIVESVPEPIPEPEPAPVIVEAVPEPIPEPEPDPVIVKAIPEPAIIVPEPEPALIVVEAIPAPEPVLEPELIPEPEPVIVEITPEPEPEPITEPEPVIVEPAPEPEPVIVQAPPEPEPVPEPEPIPEPEDPLQPYLTIDSHRNNDTYRSFVTVSGRWNDMTSISWEAPVLNARGAARLSRDGTYEFTVSAVGFSDVLDIVLSGDDQDGGTHELNLTLLNDGVGPSLAIEAPRNRDFYYDSMMVSGSIGPGPGDPPGVDEIESLAWQLEGSDAAPRPVFFDPEGGYSFRLDMRNEEGNKNLILIASDLNGNETRRNVSLIDGRLPPQIVLEGPLDGEEFGAGILLEGLVQDPYAAIADVGGFESIRYEINAVDPNVRSGLRMGDVQVTEDGRFYFPMFTNDLNGAQTLTIVATGANGMSSETTVVINPGRSAIPSFQVDSDDGAALVSWDPLPVAEGYELTMVGPGNAARRYPMEGGPVSIGPLQNGASYRFSLEAMTDRGRFASHEESVIPLASETLRPEVSGEYRRVRLEWSDIPGSEEYRVFRATSAGGPFEELASGIQDAEYLDTAAHYGVRYWYAVAPEDHPDLLSDAAFGESLAAQANRLEKVAEMRNLAPTDMTVVGDYAFTVDPEEGMVLLDVTEPTRPRVQGRQELPGARSIAVSGNYAYIAAGENGMKIINVHDPSRPLQVGSRLAGNAQSIAVSGDYAYIADADRGLRVMDVTNVRSPQRLAQVEGYVGSDVLIQGNRAYLAAQDFGVVVVNIASPEFPRETGSLALDEALSMDRRGSILAVGRGDAGLAILSLADPDQPALLAQVDDVRARNVIFYGDFLFVSGGDQLLVFDMRRPDEPFLFDTMEFPNIGTVANRGDDLLVSTADGLDIMRTFLTGQSYVIGELALESRAYGVDLSGGRLLITAHAGGLSAVDRGPVPQTAAHWESDYAEAAADLAGATIVADGFSGLRYLPAEEGGQVVVFENLGRVTDVVTQGNRGVAAAPETGLLYFETAEIGPPNLFSPVSFSGCRNVVMDENLIYAADDMEGIRIYAPLAGQAPREVGRVSHPGIRSLALDGDLLAVTAEEGLVIYDVSGTPRRVSVMEAPNAESVALKGNYAYLSAGYAGLQIYDLRNRSNPILVSSCPDVFALEAVVDGELAYVVDARSLKVVQIFIPDWLR